MDKYVKRIQSRLTALKVTLEGRTVPMWMVRQYYEVLVADRYNPTEAELAHVVESIKAKLQEPTEPTEPEVTELATVAPAPVVTIPQPEIIEITPEENPDLWEILQPPGAIAPDQDSTNGEVLSPPPGQPSTETIAPGLEPTASLVKTESNLPAPQNPGGGMRLGTESMTAAGVIAQNEVAGMVSQVFTGQPPQLQQQITEYAMERAFNNIREVQSFLENLRSTEFDLMVKTLQDHFNRRGSMLTVLDQVLSGQKRKDEEASQAFFANSHNRLTDFLKEMESRLSRTGI